MKQKDFTYYFVDEEGDPVLTVPYITSTKLSDGKLLVLILCLVLDKKDDKMIDYKFLTTFEELKREFKQVVEDEKMVFYKNERRGKKYQKGDIPCILNSEAPKHLFTQKVTTQSLVQVFEGVLEEPVISRQFFLMNDPQNLLIYESGYCLRAG